MIYTHTHTHTQQNLLVTEQKNENKKYHLTRFVIYLAIFMLSGILIPFSTVVGGLIGSMFGVKGAVMLGSGIFFLAVIVTLISPFIAAYHLIKWINA